MARGHLVLYFQVLTKTAFSQKYTLIAIPFNLTGSVGSSLKALWVNYLNLFKIINQIINKYQIDLMLIRNDSALVQIAQMDEWQIKYRDSKATILIR